MKSKQLKKFTKLTLAALAIMMFISGTYNTFVFNSKSFMKKSEVKFVKRLDEIQGDVKVAQNNWNSLSAKKSRASLRREIIAEKKINENSVQLKKRKIQRQEFAKSQIERKITKPTNNVKADPIIKQRLDLRLTSFFNMKLYKKPLKGADFEGSLYTNDGMIESLEVNLPEGKSINIAYSEMEGNIFKYELDGAEYSGMIYEAGKGNYMVNLTNGPFADTRMKFMGEAAATDPNRDIANKSIKPKNEEGYEENYDDKYDDEEEEFDKADKLEEIAKESVDNFEEDEEYESEEISRNDDEVEF